MAARCGAPDSSAAAAGDIAAPDAERPRRRREIAVRAWLLPDRPGHAIALAAVTALSAKESFGS